MIVRRASPFVGSLLALAVLSASAGAAAQGLSARGAWIEADGQRFEFARNDLRKPNDSSGTRFSGLALGAERTAAGRLAAQLPITAWGSGHRLRLARAPLSLDDTGAPDGPIRFQDETLAAAAPTELRYRFDTWRLTYTVPLLGRDDDADGWSLRAGGTLALRDAAIRPSQPGLSQSFTTAGAVPLLHLSASRRLGERFAIEAELDGAPGPNGAGLWDGAARIRWALGPGWSVAAGLRHLRGGIDNDELYSIVSGTSATLSARFAF